MKTNKLSTKLLFVGSLLLVASSCGTTTLDTALIGTSVNSVGTKAKLQSLIAETYNNYYGGWFSQEDVAMEPGSPAPNEGSGQERDYTDTNVQVEGVDEGDIVKTDGYQIYYTPRYMNRIHVFEVGEDHSITYDSLIDLGNVYTDAIYLTDDYLVVVGYTYETYSGPCFTDDRADAEPGCYSWYWWSPTGTVIVIDRVTLETVYQLETDNLFLDHRLIDNSLFLVGHHYVYQNEAELRPSFDVDGVVEYLDYSDIYYYEDTPVNGMTVLTGIKLGPTIDYTASAYLGAGYSYKQLYVSLTDLYIADTNYVYNTNSYYNTMTISQFELDVDLATMTFVGATLVEGGMLNQFSMDEYDGYLRVATTNNIATWTVVNSYQWADYKRTVENHLYVLKLNRSSQDFRLIDHLSEGLGQPGESIQSVRFDQDQAYIVTFVRTDPLYVIDLSDPRNITITDEIKLPGYDTYQHPWGENELLGLGYQADNEGRVTGMKMSAYDTTPGSSHEIQTYEFYTEVSGGMGSWTYGYSEALWNHKALLVSVEHGLFGFPVQAYEYGFDGDAVMGEEWYYRYHSYYYLFRIDFTKENPIPKPIIIEHPTSDNYYVNVDRAVMIEGYVYTLSDQQVVTYDLAANAIVEPPLMIPQPD